MALAVLLQALIVGGALVALLLITILMQDGWAYSIVVVGFVIAGALAGRAQMQAPEDEAGCLRVAPIVDRLSAVAGLRPPAVRVVSWDASLSWTSAVPFATPKLTVTTGLLQRVDDPQLEAVVGHELGHLINHDAVVMTTLIAPPIVLLRGLRAGWDKKGKWAWPKILTGLYAIYLLPVAVAGMLAGRLVGRQRELAADRAAAILCGSPARVQAALMTVSGALAQIPTRDLRLVAFGDPFHFVPIRPATGVARLWATHPPVDVRIERLGAMEARLQGK